MPKEGIISAANLPNMFKLEKPWDVVKEYPEMAWKLIKQLHDECEKYKKDIKPDLNLKPKRKQLDWHNAKYDNCGCGQYRKLVDGRCAECYDDAYNSEVEDFYIDKITELKNKIIKLEEDKSKYDKVVNNLITAIQKAIQK